MRKVMFSFVHILNISKTNKSLLIGVIVYSFVTTKLDCPVIEYVSDTYQETSAYRP